MRRSRGDRHGGSGRRGARASHPGAAAAICLLWMHGVLFLQSSLPQTRPKLCHCAVQYHQLCVLLTCSLTFLCLQTPTSSAAQPSQPNPNAERAQRVRARSTSREFRCPHSLFRAGEPPKFSGEKGPDGRCQPHSSSSEGLDPARVSPAPGTRALRRDPAQHVALPPAQTDMMSLAMKARRDQPRSACARRCSRARR